MENFKFLLRRPPRRWRHELSQFFDALSLYLEAGFDIAYGWTRAYEAMQEELAAPLRECLSVREAESLSQLLGRVAGSYPTPSHRVWFSILRELYGQGAGMRDGVRAAAAALREEHDRELEAHCRTLPTRANVVVLLFFLPPTLLMLFLPLLGELQRVFQ